MTEKWVPVPLKNQAQYDAGLIGGEGFERVISMKYAQSNTDTVYLSRDVPGFFKSTDGGETWFEVGGSSLIARGVVAMAVDKDNEDVVYACGFMGTTYNAAFSSVPHYHGIYKTIDGGDTWDLVFDGISYFQIAGSTELICIDSTDSSHVLTGGRVGVSNVFGMYATTDGGVNWSLVPFEDKLILDIVEDPGSLGSFFILTSDVLYYMSNDHSYVALSVGSVGAMTSVCASIGGAVETVVYVVDDQKNVFISTNSGTSFSIRATFGSTVISAIFVSPVDANYIYLSENHNGPAPLLSFDGGLTTSRSIVDYSLDLDSGFYFYYYVACHPTNKNILLNSSGGAEVLYKSTDAGATLSYSNSGITGVYTRGMTFFSETHFIFAAQDFGLFETTDGSTFVKLQGSAVDKSCECVDKLNESYLTVAGGWYTKVPVWSHDNGVTWNTHDGTPESSDFCCFGDTTLEMYAGSFRSLDGGTTWTDLPYKIKAVHIDSLGNRMFAAYESITDGIKQVWVSTDKCTTWVQMGPTVPVDYSISSFVFGETANDLLLAHRGGVQKYNYVNDSWTNKDENNGLTPDDFGGVFVRSMVGDPNDKNTVYCIRTTPFAEKSTGIFKSTDFGETWGNINHNLGSYVGGVSVGVDTNSRVYICCPGMHRLSTGRSLTVDGTDYKPTGWDVVDGDKVILKDVETIDFTNLLEGEKDSIKVISNSSFKSFISKTNPDDEIVTKLLMNKNRSALIIE